MTKTRPEEQMMLIDLPAPPMAPNAVVILSPKRRTPPAAAQPIPADPLAPIPDTLLGIMLVDPRFVRVDPVNARHGVPFNPESQVELIDSMRSAGGNTVPVRLRRDPAGGTEFLCPSGSQRLGAALHIQRDEPAFRLRAIIADAMDDREAFVLGEADNAGRTGVTPMQQARQWAKTLDVIYGGDRQSFIAATGRSASMVSRTLALVALPAHVLACCSDVEALTPYFAERLTPRLADADQAASVQRRAEAMLEAGRRLPGAKLIRALLDDGQAKVASAATVWRSPDGARSVRYSATTTGGRFEVANLAGVTAADRRGLVKVIDALIRELGSAPPAC